MFGGTAAMMAVSNIVNSRIVERFGARRVSHTGRADLHRGQRVAGLGLDLPRQARSVWFIPLMATNLALLGFLGANFSSIAMQPFAEIAGAASSSVQTFFRMFGAALVGIVDRPGL